MQIHGLITLSVSVVFHEPRPATFDLYFASSLVLDILDILTTLTDNLGTEVEAIDRLQVYWNAFFRPLAL